MYLSRLYFNLDNPGVRRDLLHPYNLHQTLVRGVEERKDEVGRLLFRLEVGREDTRPTVLVQTAEAPPDWAPLLANGYLTHVDGPKQIAPVFQVGQTLRFRLLANPTVKKKVEGRKNGQRVPLIHDDKNAAGHATYWDWLTRKGVQHGFEIVEAQDQPLPTARGQATGKHEVPLFGVLFDGVVRVQDADRFAEAMRSGIGSGKSFGFGLLSVGPASGGP